MSGITPEAEERAAMLFSTFVPSIVNLTPKEAEAIVAYREKNGAFKAVDDFKKVDGLDYAKIDSNKARLQF